jgi:competence ComEA-like helix-hairpin-helix protein
MVARPIGSVMHTTPHGRTALMVLFSCIGVAAAAKQGELRWLARASDAGHHPEPTPERRPVDGVQFARLRDGQSIDLNAATAEELALLPGVGPKLARDIVEARTRAGAFASVDALDDVRGIGEKKLAKLRRYLHVSGARERDR